MKSAAQRQVILLFVKYPEPGRVKTRIAATVGPEKAAGIYKALVAHVRSQLPADSEVVVCYDPPSFGEQVRAWLPGAAHYEPQVDGDLGARLRAAVDGAFAAGAARDFVAMECSFGGRDDEPSDETLKCEARQAHATLGSSRLPYAVARVTILRCVNSPGQE